MPPKPTKGKKKKAAVNDVQQQLEEQLQKTRVEIVALRDQLAVRKINTRRAIKGEAILQQEMSDAKIELKSIKDDNKEVCSDLTRLYMTMQSQMGNKIDQLTAELDETRTKLEKTQNELTQTIQAQNKMEREKDEDIARLKNLINQMTLAYESVFESALDSLEEKLSKSKTRWDNEVALIHLKNKKNLLEFGLNPKEI